MLRSYETIFIVHSELDEEKRNATVLKFKELIEKNAELEDVDEWGLRKLAYPINYQKEGYYVLVNFKAEPEFIAELERNYRITDDIIKSIVINKEA
ncbi:MAG TPA: 30S ribosomal protein S6 [Clostridiales bacterium]|nr:30S ribosomal protein S6 [Clostridiales bacterium]